MLGLQVSQHFPEKLLGHGAVPLLIGVAKRIAGRGRGASNREERRHLEPQGIAHVVEPERVADLRVEHRYHVTPGSERTGLLANSALTRKLRD